MKTTGGILLAAGLCLMPAVADAAFHLWRMTEIYSNAEGSVQFLELSSPADGEGFVQDHTLAVTAGSTTRLFVFPSGLPFLTRNKRMLIATEGFAALGLVAPDFVVPNGFFPASGGRVNFADVDVWDLPALPTDGTLALLRGGATVVNSPTNFAGRTGTVTAAGAANFQGLWWKSPADTESGWGVNIAHQGDILFVTWFTYDTDGSQMWLVGPAVLRTTGNTYTGALFRTTGPAFNAVPFGAIAFVQVGTATFNFVDANSGTFSYTVGNATQSKPVTRQVFGAPPSCTAGGSPGAAPNFSDLWYREAESGWGLNASHQGNIIFATWFTYDANGRGMWIVGPRMERTTANTFAGDLYRTTGPAFSLDPWIGPVQAIPVGSGTLAFADANSGTFGYTVNGVQQSKAITRQGFAAPATVCR